MVLLSSVEDILKVLVGASLKICLRFGSDVESRMTLRIQCSGFQLVYIAVKATAKTKPAVRTLAARGFRTT